MLRPLQGIGETLLRPLSLVSDVLDAPAVLAETDQRPWPPPSEPWLMAQRWVDLLFAHWRVPTEQLEAVVPPQLPLDTHDGSAWIGVTPFEVRDLRLRGTLPLPLTSSFPELNVRTYVVLDGKLGIYFLSLDAASRAAVTAARRLYRLPYFHARMDKRTAMEGIEYSSWRVDADGPPAELQIRYGAEGEALPVRDGSLERWLSERYCLYTLDGDGRVLRGEIHHPPWPLRRGWAEIEVNTMSVPFGIGLEGEPLLHFSARQDVVIWPLRPHA